MGSDIVFESDRRQSISQQDVDAIVAANERASVEVFGQFRDVPEPGIVCARDAKHGRMLMSLKTQSLECGVCGYMVAAPK